MLRLRIATTERFMTKAGERQERTEWHTVVFFGKRAEGLSKVLGKGQSVYVEGRLQTRSWDDREGNKRYTTEIVGNQLLFLGSRREGGGGGGGSGGGGSGGGGGGDGGDDYRGGGGEPSGGEPSGGEPAGGGSQDDFPADDFGDDDIPF